MKCKTIEALLAAYLHNEVTPSEKKVIQAHLASCATCQTAFEGLSSTGERVTQFFQERAERVNPPEDAWERLQARLFPEQGSRSRNIVARVWTGYSPSRRLAAATGLLLLLFLLMPPVWALAGRIGDWLGSFYGFKVQDLRAEIGGFDAFHPYYPTYAPKGFTSIGLGGSTGPGWDVLELTFSRRDRFFTILQSKGLAESKLPAGEPILIQGQNGIHVPGFADSPEDLQKVFPYISITTDFNYTGLDLLVWYTDEIRIALITNLPHEEAVKIAESLALMDDFQAEVKP